MNGRRTLALVTTNVVALIALAFVYPHLMVSPGPLIAAHSELTAQCASCHTLWQGPDPLRCISCHVVADIGVRTTDNTPIVRRTQSTGFHQQLLMQDCTACHSDHQGPLATEQNRVRFSHALLRTEVRQRCETCHAPPINRIHSGITGNCVQCHSQNAWKPATFDHSQQFQLDRHHNPTCVTCHTGGDYTRYTCYGCHAHSEPQIRAKHEEEGIRNFQDCARCHRGGTEQGERREGRNGGRTRSDRESD